MPRPWLAALLLALALPARADEPFALKGGERIVFFGDSITQAGHYATYVEAYLLTRFPGKTYTLINHGISSETISGLSEPDHPGRRPDAHDRFTRDVTDWRPDVVVACFGMNDGIYAPFDEARFARYQAGIRRLIARTRDEAHARLILLTPPPFDPYRRVTGDPAARDFGYRFPAVDYDRTLGRYADWLMTLRDEGLVVADVHAAINDHLGRRRVGQVSYYVSGDAVHPNETGHWLMAQALLLALHAPATAAEAQIDAESLRVEAGDVADLAREGDGLRFALDAPLPLPVDPKWDRKSIALERVGERLNRYVLRVRGLAAGRYRLTAGEATTTVTREALDEGIPVADLAGFPPAARSRDVLARLKAHRAQGYERWRKQVAGGGPAEENDEPMREIRERCRPVRVVVSLVPVVGP